MEENQSEENIELEKRIKFIIKSSPYGETEPVISGFIISLTEIIILRIDLTNLIKNINLNIDDFDTTSILKEFNETHFTPIKYSDDTNKVSEIHYFDLKVN